MNRLLLPLAVVLAGCAERAAEDSSSWYEHGQFYDVEETVEFTDQPYSFPVVGPGIGNLLNGINTSNFTTYYGDSEAISQTDCSWEQTSQLPAEIEGIVTIQPRYYQKVSGCSFDDLKYYGSYFIQDSTGGILVLGDSKVAHFDSGQRVRLTVTGAGESYDLPRIVSHEVVSVSTEREPVYYQELTSAPTSSDVDKVGEVWRVEGTILGEPGNFGDIEVQLDNGDVVNLGLDVELNRRKVYEQWPVGSRIRATGPMTYSFSEFKLIIMRIGQVEVLSSTNQD